MVWQRYLDDDSIRSKILSCATPAVFYSEEQLLANISKYDSLSSLVGDCVSLCCRFAVKACGLSRVLQSVAKAGWGADCQSVMESKLAIRSGIAPEKLTICSPRLSESETRWALEQGVTIVADSVGQLEMVAAIVGDSGQARLGARLSLDVEGTARFHTKLGMELADLIDLLERLPQLRSRLNELHHHGMAREVDAILPCQIAAVMAGALSTLESHAQVRITHLNLGGGLEPDSLLAKERSTADIFSDVVKAMPKDILNGRTLVLEPGRAIVKDSALALTQVTNLKKLRGTNVAVVDVSTNLLIPLPLAKFRVTTVNHTSPAGLIAYDVVDGTCSPAGVIERGALLPELKPGSKLLVYDCGAYTWSLAEPFYDWLPDLWWINGQDDFHLAIGRDDLRKMVDLVWGYN